MAKKEIARKKGQPTRAIAPAPVRQEHTEWWRHAHNILLDWRFNLAVLAFLELLIVILFLPNEIASYRRDTARQAMLRKNYDTAEKYFKALVRSYPDNATYLQGLGDVYLEKAARQGNDQDTELYQYALSCYEKAMGLNSELPDIRIMAARAYYGLLPMLRDEQRKQGEKQCQDLLSAAIKENPNSLKVNLYWGQFKEEMGDLVGAADRYSRVRAEMIPLHQPPNAEQKALIDEARTRLARVRGLIMKEEYSLDLAGMPEVRMSGKNVTAPPTGAEEVAPQVPRPSPRPQVTSGPVAAMPPKASASPTSAAPPLATTSAPAPAVTSRPTPAVTPVSAPVGTPRPAPAVTTGPAPVITTAPAAAPTSPTLPSASDRPTTPAPAVAAPPASATTPPAAAAQSSATPAQPTSSTK
jgi:hypothetical protein